MHGTHDRTMYLYAASAELHAMERIVFPLLTSWVSLCHPPMHSTDDMRSMRKYTVCASVKTGTMMGQKVGWAGTLNILMSYLLDVDVQPRRPLLSFQR